MNDSRYLRLWQTLFTVALLSRLAAGFIWIYQGLVPKLLVVHPDEINLLLSGGLSQQEALRILPWIGWGEIIFGLIVIISYRQLWPMLLSAFVMVMATVGVAGASPAYLGAAFNPVTLNIGLMAISVIGALSLWGIKKALPS
jgi:uncharacterized membrane protein YphA (DoxX/SURF4 family)